MHCSAHPNRVPSTTKVDRYHCENGDTSVKKNANTMVLLIHYHMVVRNRRLRHDGPVKPLLLGLALVVGCTRPNPEVCCGDAADCNAAGIPEGRTCAADLVCVNHSCEEPIIEPPECTESGQCTTATEAICDTSTLMCRGCIDDAECDSGACGDDGACVAEAQVLYIRPSGQNIGTCTRTMPCLTVAYAVSQATDTRYDFVFAPGTYSLATPIEISETSLFAPRANFHGHRARIAVPNTATYSVAFYVGNRPAMFRDMELVSQPNIEMIDSTGGAGVTFKRVTLSGSITFRGPLVIDQMIIAAQSFAISHVGAGGTVDITNLLVYGASDAALQLSTVTGSIRSSTIAYTGSASAQPAVVCGGAVTLQSTIVWTPQSNQLPVDNCILDNVIAGPMPVLGARNADPDFVNPSVNDFHLGLMSPARDAADVGPNTDFEGDPRPQGERFDLGADEAAP